MQSSTVKRPTLPPLGQDKGNETTSPPQVEDETDEWSCKFNDHIFKQGQEIDTIYLKDELKDGFPCFESCACHNDTQSPVIECYQIKCEEVKIPKDKNCTKVKEDNECCEKLKCGMFLNFLKF